MANQRPELSLLAFNNRANQIKTSSPAVSSTDSDSDTSTSTSTSAASPRLPNPETSFYKSAQWTRDGTTIITSSYDLQISTFLVPNNLLEPRDHPLTLQPHKILRLAEPTNVVAAAPYYDLRYANTDHFLVACRDHPVQLYSALSRSSNGTSDNILTTGGGGEEEEHIDDDGIATRTANTSPQPQPDLPLGSYPLVSPTTEAYLSVHSLVWPSPGTHFYVGTRDLIAAFDITRNGAGPTTQIPTIPSRRHIRKGNGIGMRGTVSAMSAQIMPTNDGFDMPTGILAAGTWTRWVGLYDVHRSGECTATWGVKEAAENAILTDPPEEGMKRTTRGIGGAGILQTAWSPCGRYLVLNERQSTGMLVYDVRVTNKLLGVLAGRDATTHQRLTCDVFRGLDTVGGFEVWAGTRDGAVQVWEGVGNVEGCQWPSWDFSATDGKSSNSSGSTSSNSLRQSGERLAAAPAVGSVALHYSGSVVATASGCWGIRDANGDGDGEATSESDSSLEDSEDEVTGSLAASDYRSENTRRFQQSGLKLWSIGTSSKADEPLDTTDSMAIDEDVAEVNRKDEHWTTEIPDPASADRCEARLAGDLRSGYDTADEVEQQIAREQASYIQTRLSS